MLESVADHLQSAVDVVIFGVVTLAVAVAGYMIGYACGRLVRRFTTEMPVLDIGDDDHPWPKS